MAIPKYKRTSESKLQFMHNALELRKKITNLLLRDFGLKDKVRNTKAFLNNTCKMDESDSQAVMDIMQKYNLNKEIVDEYPKWWVDYERSLIMNLLSELISNIIQANSIYVSTEQEYHNRRTYWNNAIGNCNTLLNEFEYIRHVLPIDAEKYMSYVDMINNEIALIKGVRKSDNKVLKKLTNTKE